MMAVPTMDLHGQALLDYLGGEEQASYTLRRDDGFAYPLISARQFFYPDGLPELDRVAVAHCVGRVLDVGAGAGSHSLAIQDRGLEVVTVDASPLAVQVMTRRGVRDARVGELFDSYPGPFDTVFIVQNIGIVGDLDGLDRFLRHLDRLLAVGGRLITDSIDPLAPTDESSRHYQEAKVHYQAAKVARRRYLGERTLRLEYKGRIGDWFEWMHLDPQTLRRHVGEAGYRVETLATESRRFLVSIRRESEDENQRRGSS
jgi:SAM-dependent methyltransferase